MTGERKYQLGTEENRAFLKAMGEEVLRFGRKSDVTPLPNKQCYFITLFLNCD